MRGKTVVILSISIWAFWIAVVVGLAIAIGGFGVPATPVAAITISIGVVLSMVVAVWIGVRERAYRQANPDDH